MKPPSIYNQHGVPQKGQHAWCRHVRSFGPRLAWWLSQVGTYRLSRGIAQNLGGFNTKMVSFWIGERLILGNTQMFMKISLVEALNSRSSRMSGARIMPQAWGLMMFDLRQCVVFWGWWNPTDMTSPREQAFPKTCCWLWSGPCFSTFPSWNLSKARLRNRLI